MNHELVLYHSRRVYGVGLTFCIAFVALGVFVLWTRGSRFVAWANIVCFGVLLILFLRKILDRRPRVILNDAGVFDRVQAIGVIPWCDIQNAYVWSHHRNRGICLVLTDTAHYVAKLSPAKRAQIDSQLVTGATPITVLLSDLDADPQHVLGVILNQIIKNGDAAVQSDATS